MRLRSTSPELPCATPASAAESARLVASAALAAGVEQGLTPLYAVASSDDDWDRYQGLTWRAAERWAAANPGDPDREAVLARVRAARDTYLGWERELFGWAIYVWSR